MITILLIIVQIRDKHLREDLDYHMKMLEMLVILLTGIYIKDFGHSDVEDQLPQWLVLAIKVSFWAAIKEVIKALSHFQWYHWEVR